MKGFEKRNSDLLLTFVAISKYILAFIFYTYIQMYIYTPVQKQNKNRPTKLKLSFHCLNHKLLVRKWAKFKQMHYLRSHCFPENEFLAENGKLCVEWWITLKHKLNGDAPERCLQTSGEKYNSKCISITVKNRGRGVIVCRAVLAARIGELYFTVKIIQCFGVQENCAEWLASHKWNVVIF